MVILKLFLLRFFNQQAGMIYLINEGRNKQNSINDSEFSKDLVIYGKLLNNNSIYKHYINHIIYKMFNLFLNKYYLNIKIYHKKIG